MVTKPSKDLSIVIYCLHVMERYFVLMVILYAFRGVRKIVKCDC
jgi:hypothetical protein